MLQDMHDNPAARLGPAKFPWWPNWLGETFAVVACGPSLKKSDCEMLKGRVRVIAIKEAFDCCPFADVVYGCDAPWWRHRRGLPGFNGLKLRWSGNHCNDYPDVHPIDIADKNGKRIEVAKPGVIGAGQNSGFQGLNLAVQFGGARGLLLGFDCREGEKGPHFYGRNNWSMARNPDWSNWPKWMASFDQAAQDCANLGVEVVNCSPGTAIKSFPRIGLADTLKAWGL